MKTVATDTNLLVDYLFTLKQGVTYSRQRIAQQLMISIEFAETIGIISEIVIHECFVVLVMREKAFTVPEFCDAFQEMLLWPGWEMDEMQLGILLRAFQYLAQSPKLEFSDAVIAARAEAYGAELATFDKGLLAAYDGPVWSID